MPSLTSYEDDLGQDAAMELERLGDERAMAFIRHCTRVVSGKADHLEWLLFDDYLGIPFYCASIDNCFAIYAVEDDGANERKVTVMHAARLGDRSAGGLPWDGKDMDMIRDRIVRPRAARWFQPAGTRQ